MFMLASAHMIYFVYAAMNNIRTPRFIQSTSAIGMIQMLVGDSVLIWRVWVIWNHNLWVALLPIAIVISSSAFGFYSAADLTMKDLFANFALPTAVFSILNTVVCTLLIVGRLWYVGRQLHQTHGPTYPSSSTCWRTAVLMIALGTLYSVTVAIGIVLDVFHSQGLYPVLEMNVQWIGILLTVIIIRAHVDTVPKDRVDVTHLSQETRRGASKRLSIAPTDPYHRSKNPPGGGSPIDLSAPTTTTHAENLGERQGHPGPRMSVIDITRDHVNDRGFCTG